MTTTIERPQALGTITPAAWATDAGEWSRDGDAGWIRFNTRDIGSFNIMQSQFVTDDGTLEMGELTAEDTGLTLTGDAREIAVELTAIARQCIEAAEALLGGAK